MPSLRVSEWRKLPLSLTELCIDTTLRCGQSFRWKKTDDEWHMVLHGRLLSLKQDDTYLHYKATWPSKTSPGSEKPSVPVKEESPPPLDSLADDTEDLIRHYFSLKHDAGALYEQWSQNDANFRRKAPRFTGIRILSQDAWEALIGFICSSNNNISRISQMVHKLCLHYGPSVARIGGGSADDGELLHDFPDAAALAGAGVEAHLRQLGFGYRARYIAETARIVAQDKPPEWLETLTNPESPGWGAAERYGTKLDRVSYREAHDELLTLSGVGPKVADCVCLMGLGWGEAVPVDTHVWQIAQRDYKLGGKVKSKTFSKAMYDTVGDHFRGIWGSQAGWAQSVLFTANLKSFSDRSAVKPEVEGIKIEVEEKLVLEEAKPKTKRKRAVLTETVKLEEVSVKIEDNDTKRRRTRSSTRK
ncbi:hypothetical protein PFICI_01965 [Pestalotiopsis fici W106-1]|uniref:DNA-(apurinic or apyrimidinic site) lyase n=1 Tax=Pestalotiopsis fici (strain W106-1 / CGMCC3.15140) TaxID=1229662 RepID=W3XRK2_PESFW|nr:uncharacterized protein PFICI_01965 [Pestalotiopsis fici W106-1]ETS88137.1 hypothetical protein PFICI_01965 [Pestalotiopsis fici W106-1]